MIEILLIIIGLGILLWAVVSVVDVFDKYPT